MTNCILKLILPLFHESSYLFHSEPNLAVDRCLHSCTLSPCRKKQDTPWTLPKESPVFHKHPTVYIMYVYIYMLIMFVYVYIYNTRKYIYIYTHITLGPPPFSHMSWAGRNSHYPQQCLELYERVLWPSKGIDLKFQVPPITESTSHSVDDNQKSGKLTHQLTFGKCPHSLQSFHTS